MTKDKKNGSKFDALRRIGNQANDTTRRIQKSFNARPVKKDSNTRPINEEHNPGANQRSND